MAARTKTVFVRNLSDLPINIRLGSKGDRDRYAFALKPRGALGDVHELNEDLVLHPQFKGNLGVAFEIITKTEAQKIEYPPVMYARHPIYAELQQKPIVHQNDNSVMVASVDSKGNLSRGRQGEEVKVERATPVGSEEKPIKFGGIVRSNTPQGSSDA